MKYFYGIFTFTQFFFCDVQYHKSRSQKMCINECSHLQIFKLCGLRLTVHNLCCDVKVKMTKCKSRFLCNTIQHQKKHRKIIKVAKSTCNLTTLMMCSQKYGKLFCHDPLKEWKYGENVSFIIRHCSKRCGISPPGHTSVALAIEIWKHLNNS